MSDAVHVRAPAKVNLFLRVLGRRPDGFHDLETLFQAIDLCDLVEVRLQGGGVDLEVEGAELGPPEENLAFRAADGFRRLFRLSRGVRVRLEKRIPAGAGLGGGSSDAAAVLRCLTSLFDVAPDAPDLLHLAEELGSDVPFFLCGSALALGTGRGEVLEPLTPLPARWMVIALPPVHVATGAAYQALAESRAGTRPPAARAGYHPPASWREVLVRLENDFQGIVASEHRSVERSLTALERAGAAAVSLSGSGAACFGIFESRAGAEEAASRSSRDFGWPFAPVRTLTKLPEPEAGLVSKTDGGS